MNHWAQVMMIYIYIYDNPINYNIALFPSDSVERFLVWYAFIGIPSLYLYLEYQYHFIENS